MILNRKKKGDKSIFKSVIFWAFCLSIILHCFFIFSHFDFIKLTSIKEKMPRKLKVILVDKKPPIKREHKGKKLKQIVNTEQNNLTKKSIESRFLGKSNQSYDRQVTAQKIGSFKKAGKGKKDIRNKKIDSQIITMRDKKIKLSDLAFNKKAPIRKKQKKRLDMKALGIKTGDKKQTGLAQNNDFIEDLPLGNMTHLNTVEYKYFGFYDRIRKKLERFWGNSLQQKAEILYRQGRRLPANVNKITSLTVTIDSKGNIIDVYVKSTSGVSELDDAAVESFNKAGPFPNPPLGMLKNGVAKIEWGFVVKS